ncbi:MAG: hypothetical protein V4584_08630 [Verrucomicrobiota bacterium]
MTPFPDRIYFSVSFPFIPDPLGDAWDMIAQFLRGMGCLPKQFEVSQIAGHQEIDQSPLYLKLSSEQIGKLIRDRNLSAFQVNTGHSSRSVDFTLYNSIQLGQLALLTCRVEKEAKAPDDWKVLIEKLIGRFPAIGAWQWKHRYLCWQRLNRIDSGYEDRWGPLPPGYRTWREPFPGPISQPDQVFVDISMNPGRPKNLAGGVHFCATAEMWLGPHFWQYARCTKEEALAADFFIEKVDTPDYLYLKCWPTAFTRPDGEQGRMQQKLWKLFFHEDCEWPPGSGTICDEPIYGPPELMPTERT